MVPTKHRARIDIDRKRAHALYDWSITPLAGGRHLVEHLDLDAWYTGEHPDPDTLTKARADFGDMIMTPALIRENTPWT